MDADVLVAGDDRHVRGACRAIYRLSPAARREVCNAFHRTTIDLAGDAIDRLKDGNVDAGWKYVNEARALTNFSKCCPVRR